MPPTSTSLSFRARLALCLLAPLAILPASPRAEQISQPMGDMVTINTALANFLRAYQEKNLQALTAEMANEVRVFGPAFTAAGLDEFRSRAPLVLRDVQGIAPRQQDVTMSGNLAFVAFPVEIQHAAGAGGQTSRERWTLIFQRLNNRWLIVHWHASGGA